jgi:sulfur carrier protein
MQIFINQHPVELPGTQASVADALAQWNARPPYAVALNTQFVPKSQYASQALHEGDRLEVISPVTGG